MPVTYKTGRVSAGQIYDTILDWTRRLLQLSGAACVLLYGYLFYGLFFGAVGQWGVLKGAERLQISSNIDGAILYLNIALGLLLLTLCILYYDEESTGYVLVGASVALYYGLPFLMDMFVQGQLADWDKTKNTAALAIMNQIKIAALMMAVPGGILTLRDLVLRIIDGSGRRRDEFTAMQFGGAVQEEEEPPHALLGIFAKCWQLPYCRAAIRKACPIFLNKARCWKERVGCMCEENVIRHSMDALIGKAPMSFNPMAPAPDTKDMPGVPGLTLENPQLTAKSTDKTVTMPRKVDSSQAGKHVKIPHNPNLSMAAKKERCRNCVIYNEHQRMKYQFLAPISVLFIPIITFLEFDYVVKWLNTVLRGLDSVMGKLSLTPGTHTDIASGFMGGGVQVIVIGCVVVILTTMMLRGLEFCLFKLKI